MQPHCESKGVVREADYFLTHAIWRNSYGGSQPETGVRTVDRGKVNEDFQLIEHGCPDFEWVTPLVLRLLRAGRDPYRVGEVVGWLWQRRRRALTKAAFRKMHDQFVTDLSGGA